MECYNHNTGLFSRHQHQHAFQKTKKTQFLFNNVVNISKQASVNNSKKENDLSKTFYEFSKKFQRHSFLSKQLEFFT